MATYRIRINDKEFKTKLLRREYGRIEFEINAKNYSVELEPIIETQVITAGPVAQALAPSPKAKAAQSGDIIAPMPGIVVSLAVKAGDEITVGQTVAVIEAMKMENNITAPRAGRVKQILIKPGQEVSNAEVLMRLE